MFSELPVSAILPALSEQLARGHVVLTAPPGSGKTTMVPLALRQVSWLAGGRIVMLEPRRPAARLAARRMAGMLGESPGGQVGYQVRMDRCIGPDTRIEVVTEGILTRRLQSDPELAGVGLVIFDEFHERNLQSDLGLSLCLDVCASLRDDLRLLVMSATLDPGPLCKLLPATHLEADGRHYPVDVAYLPPRDKREPLAAMPALVRQAVEDTRGDILAFVPGRGEMARLAEALDGLPLPVDQLYGDLPADAQDRVLVPRPDGQRRVVLSTDLAESSLTIEGISAVVDSGLARKPVFDANSGMTRLQLGTVSRASADQRAGRAGRLGPGRCYRAWTEEQHQRRDAFRAPELATADLAPLVLELAAWGVSAPDGLRWLDMPPPAHWDQASQLLMELGALDSAGRITAAGRDMSRLGLDPRLARLLLAASTRVEQHLACDLAALLSERDVLPPGSGLDLTLRLDALQAWRQHRRVIRGAVRQRLEQAARVSQRLLQRLDEAPAGSGRTAGALLATAFPDRVARRRGEPGRFVLSNGRGAAMDQAEGLCAADWLVVPSLDAGQREGRIWSAVAVAQADLLMALAHLVNDREELSWDDARQAVAARQVRRLGPIEVSSRAVAPADMDAARALLLDRLHRDWPRGLAWSKPVRQWLDRARRMRALGAPDDWPDLADDTLRTELHTWLAPWLGERLSYKALADLDLLAVLRERLDWDQQQRLERWLPTHLQTPAGTRRAIDYGVEGAPRVAVPLQEMFGEPRSPSLADGRLSLVLELLNPAGRPIQVTADLAGFWAGTWVDVRKELRGRYPKHDWPEDPTQVPARRGTGRVRRP